ncbi:hypothetical protein CCO03_16945 [Comamonas serinivorans]|uniref:Uncharacterized protein n=1 Tax=Comamonas serinivorans TaxID=1082851 RepID=A0A1Y0ERA0_9BURK|nr:hypothetical protein [Comamonas serinivorans]ARU06133.1 hypothetical protein CCO03_16945 [Comamonas serinivorans]
MSGILAALAGFGNVVYDNDFFLMVQSASSTNAMYLKSNDAVVRGVAAPFSGRVAFHPTAGTAFHIAAGPARYSLDKTTLLTRIGSVGGLYFSFNLENDPGNLTFAGMASGATGFQSWPMNADGSLGALMTKTGVAEVTGTRQIYHLASNQYISVVDSATSTIQQWTTAANLASTVCSNFSYARATYGTVVDVQSSPRGIRAVIFHSLSTKYSFYSRAATGSVWSRLSLTLPSFANTAANQCYGDWSNDGTRFVISGSNASGPALFVYNVSTAEAFTYAMTIQMSAAQGVPNGVDVDMTGRFIAVTTANNTLYVYQRNAAGTAYTLAFTDSVVGTDLKPRFCPRNLD